MKVDENGLLVRVTARVTRRVLRGQNTAEQTEAIHASPVLLLRLLEVDGKRVNNNRSFIYYSKRIAKLKVQDGDVITFLGYARANRNGYHFVHLRNIQVRRKVEPQQEQRVWGILPEHVPLKDFVEYVIPQLQS